MASLQKEIFIQAPVKKVWAHLSDPAKVSAWLMPTDLEAVPGRDFTFRYEGDEKQEWEKDWDRTVRCRVLEASPPRKISYTWESGLTGGPTTVTFTLEPQGEHTLLRLVHAGWNEKHPRHSDFFNLHNNGWQQLLTQNLKPQAESPA